MDITGFVGKRKKGKVAQSCPTLCDPMNCSPPGSSVHSWSVQFVAVSRQESWVAFSSSRGIFPTQGSNPVLPRCRWTQSHLVDKDQRSTWTLDTGHGDGSLPGSAGPRSDVQGEAEFTGSLSRGLPGPGQRFLVAGAWADFLGGAAEQQWTVDSDLGRSPSALRVPSPCRRHRHADPQDCSPLDSASGQQLPGSAGAETPAAPIPYQHHPAQGQL